MGSRRSPCFSFRITTYEFEELSSPRRSTRTSIIPRSPASRDRASGAHVPRREILALLRGQLIDARAHRFELQARNLPIDCFRNTMHVLGKGPGVLH